MRLASDYNQLPDIFPADEILRSKPKDKVLGAICEMLIDKNASDVIGIRLLHRHNSIHQGEMMLEREEITAYGPALVTATCNNSLGDFAPNSWMHNGVEWCPMEFSEDRAVVQACQNSDRFKPIFDDFLRISTDYGCSSILGPCIVPRQFDRHRLTVNDRLVEVTDELRHANVLYYASVSDYKSDQLIDATWIAKPRTLDEALLGCRAYCSASGCVTHTACVLEGANHRRVQNHSRGNHSPSHIQT